MAVAAYASVLSLIDVLDRIQHPARLHLHLNTKQIQTLQENVHFLQEFLEVHSQGESEQVPDLARQIAEVANEAESIIDFHAVDQLREGFDDEADMGLSLLFCESTTDTGISSFYEDLHKVIEKIDSIKSESLTMVKEGKALQEPRVFTRTFSLTLSPIGNNSMVGFDDYLVQIMDELTGHQQRLQIISIVGMGGIGKTTLATNVFDNLCIVEHFHLRSWSTISQQYSIQEILVRILHGLEAYASFGEDVSVLGERLYKHLWGRMYLIVMDDLWSTEFWDDVKFFFPDNRNGSRIVVTTRLSDVAACLSSQSPYVMSLLDEDKSWNLFCEQAFGKEICPPELEDIGKNIARSCKGLPLALVVVGGLLRNSETTRENWEFVARNAISYANSENDEQCLQMLALSYHHLPIELKPCFLYMRVFPEDHNIRVSKLINLWIAEGLIKPSRARNLEDVAQECLKDLIGRNLILIRERGQTGEIKACGVHDLLRDLCIRESSKENFIRVPKVQIINTKNKGKMCFLCSDEHVHEKIQLREVIIGSSSSSFVDHWVCGACTIMYSQLIRVRSVKEIRKLPIPTTLRYLTFKSSFHPSFFSCSSIPLLWNLQTIFINGYSKKSVALPSEIWDMPQLRHLKIILAKLPKPVDNRIETNQHCSILENLHTLSYIINFRLTDEVLKRMPNIKKLKISYFEYSRKHWSYYKLHNLARLCKLEKLCIRAAISSSKIIAFPHSLKELTLNWCAMPWEDMSVIGSLPNLEVLKLRSDAFKGPEWNPVEGEFLRLRFLSIDLSDLVIWRAENVHFPCLERLVLRSVHTLEEIPLGIGDIGTLCLIELVRCSEMVNDSAMRILEEQVSMGNEDLQVYVTDGNGRRKCKIDA